MLEKERPEIARERKWTNVNIQLVVTSSPSSFGMWDKAGNSGVQEEFFWGEGRENFSKAPSAHFRTNVATNKALSHTWLLLLLPGQLSGLGVASNIPQRRRNCFVLLHRDSKSD